MVAVPAGQQPAHSVPVAGANAVSAFSMPSVSVRGATDAQMTKWRAAFRNCCALYGLGPVVEEGQPPQRDAVTKKWPMLERAELVQKYNDCLRQYQSENTALFFHVISSLDLAGEWEQHDYDHIDRHFVSGDLRDGNGLLKWFLSFHDISTPARQKSLRLALSKFKISVGYTQKQLLKTLLDYLAVWEKLSGNSRSDPVLLNDYYTRILDLWPTEPYENPLVRARISIASMLHQEDKMLSDVAASINTWMNAAKAYGVPVGASTTTTGTVLATGDRLTAADNQCKYCDVFGCKANDAIKKCVVFNKDIAIGEGSKFPKDMQVRFIKGARAHLEQNQELKSMKGVKFLVEKPPHAGGGKGRGGGGRGGSGGGGRGGGGGRSAAPIIFSASEVDFFGDEGENAEDFDAWVQNMQNESDGHVAAPVFARFFGGGDPPQSELTEAIREEIARASAVAAEAAVVAATPMPASGAASNLPNPALTPLPPSRDGQVTPVVRSSLAALRETQPASGGGTTPAAVQVSRGASRAAPEDERTITERLFEAGASALKQERLLSAKSQAKSRLGSWFEAILKVLGLDKTNKFQRAQLAFVFYCALWPNTTLLKLVRDKVLKQLAIARDTFISTMAAKLIGLTSTGILISLGANGSSSGSNSGAASNPAPLVADLPANVTTATTPVDRQLEFNTSRSATPSSRSATPLSPIQEIGPEAVAVSPTPPIETKSNSSDVNINVNTLSSADSIDSQGQSRVKSSETDAALLQEKDVSVNNENKSVDPGNDADAQNLPSEKQKVIMVHGYGKFIRTGIDHNAESALTSSIIKGIPRSALLFDNGATVSCSKTNMGRLLGSFVANEDDCGISVGDESSTLTSQGSYLHALNIQDANGTVVTMLCRFEDTPNAICNIFSEPEEVYNRGGKFSFTDEGRIWTLADGRSMRLHMTGNHLAWAKISPVTDSAVVRELLGASKIKLIANVRRTIATASNEAANEDARSLTAYGQVVCDSATAIDTITTAVNMLPYVDPTFQSIDRHVPMLASDLKTALAHLSGSSTFVEYESETTFDPPDEHWLSQVQRDFQREVEWRKRISDNAFLVSPNENCVLVQRSTSTKNSGTDNNSIVAQFTADLKSKLGELASPDARVRKLVSMAADARMALQRTCTSYQQPSDEAISCNIEYRLPVVTYLINELTGNRAESLIDSAYAKLQDKYSTAEWCDMVDQRNKWLTSSGRARPRAAVTFAHKTGVCADPCCKQLHENFTFTDVLVDGHDADATKAILSLAKAPPSTVGMARAVPLTGVEILWRTHVVLGHCSLQQVLATLAKTKGLRAGVVTKGDIEAFAKLGCQQCIIWKMRRAPIRTLVDATRAPPGKKWSYDTLTLKVKTTANNIYITRFLDDGSGFKRSYGHPDFSSATMQKVLGMHRAWVRPTHGEIWIGKRDNHPSQAAKSFQEMLSVAQIQDQATAPYQHESMPVELTWQHDVPCAMILLATGPGAKALRHFEAAFLTHEDASNRTVKTRVHDGAALSSHMIYYNESVARVNLLFAFFAPLMYLVFPEVRENKFSEHALPGAYYGPSRSTESDNYCDVWNGSRFFAVHKGCLRIDERGVLALSSRTNKSTQPFTKEADADPAVDLPNFDQWTDPSIEKPISQQSTPAIIETELDADLSPGDADPTTPFILFLHAGHRRLGELGHYVKRLTKSKARVVAVDTKRRGYAHNVLLPRVFAWLERLAALALCIAILISAPCAPFAPMRLDRSTQGPPVLFDRSNPDGVKLSNGSVHPLADAALRLHDQGLKLARIVHSHGGGVIVEHPVNHGADSLWPIKGREEHSTLFETSLFQHFTKDVPGERVFSDQCAAGASTRKTTQWYCNERLLNSAFKYLGVLHCPERETPDHPWPHNKTLVGKNDAGEWNSDGSDEYTSTLSGLLALTLIDGHDFTVPAQPSSDVFDDFASLAPSAGPDTEPAAGGGDDSIESSSSKDDSIESSNDSSASASNDADNSVPDDPNTPDEAFAELEQRIRQGAGQGAAVDAAEAEVLDSLSAPDELPTPEPVTSHSAQLPPDPPDPYPAGTTVQVYWEDEKNWYTGKISKTDVWRGPNGQSKHPRRQIHISYDDGKDLVHSLHNTKVRAVATNEVAPGLQEVYENAPSTPAAAPSPSPPMEPSTPRTLNDQGQPAAPSLPSFLPTHLKVVSESGAAPSFVHHGEKVTALPEPTLNPDVQAMEYEAALDSYEAFDPTNAIMVTDKSNGEFGVPYNAIHQARSGDVGLGKFVACATQSDQVLAQNTDPISLISHEYDIEHGQWFRRHIITAMVNGTEHNLDPADANNWHTPKNEREYLRSPQRAMWRTAKEKKMDQYSELKVYKLVPRKGIDPKRIMGSLWAYKIKFDEKGLFEKLNPRWCVKGYAMDKSMYVGFSEVCQTSTVKVLACIRATYPVKDFLFDCGNAFQATRTDDGTVKSQKLYCEQAPGFSVKDTDGSPMVCEILVALQGRVDAARLFGDRLEQIVFELGGARSTWDPKLYYFDFSPLVNTSATLGEVLKSCKKMGSANNEKGRPFGWAAMCVHVDDCPGVSSSDRLTDYIKAGIMVQYECKHGPWKKVLGFKFTCTDDSVTMSAEHTIESMYNTYLVNHPKFDARLPGRDITLTAGDPPAQGDPRLPSYKEMQAETRSLLGLLLWVSLAYPQISYHVNRACGFMSNPSHSVNSYAKQIALHLFQYPVPVKWGGSSDLELSSPSPAPYSGKKEYGLHFAADASPGDETRGITGGVGMLAGGAIVTISARQHLATSCMHSNELLAAGTIVHKIVPIRGLLTELRIPQELPTPLYLDSASTVFVAQSRAAVKKSAWMRRRAEVLTQAYDLGEIMPIKIEEYNNFADPQTKYLTYKVWARHLHYTHNLSGEPPPPVDKPGKKGPSTAKVLSAKDKATLLLAVGL